MDYSKKTLNELLSYEVAQIDDDDIRNFVKMTLDNVDPIHRIKPASSTGKYHPKYAAGEGGLIRHTKVVVRNVIELIRATPAVESEKDELIAAAIIHDMWKYPEGRDHEFTAFDHPALGGQWCKDHGFETIGRLVAAHQGIWTTSRQMPGFENEQPRKFDEWVLHYADYFASRAYLACDFDEMGDVILDPWATRKEDTAKPAGRTIKD
jgi:hypothetical protein